MASTVAKITAAGLTAAFAVSAEAKPRAAALDPQIAAIMVEGCRENALELSRNPGMAPVHRTMIAHMMRTSAERMRNGGYDPSPCLSR